MHKQNIEKKGFNELGACKQVAVNDHDNTCGSCSPFRSAAPDTNHDALGTTHEEDIVKPSSSCPPCSGAVCNSEINYCQITTTIPLTSAMMGLQKVVVLQSHEMYPNALVVASCQKAVRDSSEEN